MTSHDKKNKDLEDILNEENNDDLNISEHNLSVN